MRYSTIPILIYLMVTLIGCATAMPENRTNQPRPPKTQYDAIITDANGRLLSINQLAVQLRDTDVIVFGEFHGHHASHLLQSLLQSALFRQRPGQILSMEQFELDDQQVLNLYLNGETGEAEMISDTDAWSNYRASYRPLVEFARANALPVIAANAPAGVVRCVGRQGLDYLDTLDDAERIPLPDLPLTETPAYREKFFTALGHGHGNQSRGSEPSERMENSYQAQLLRDNTMAKRIIDAADAHPDRQILHLTGTFHSESRLGTVAVLEQKRPELSVAVISPVVWKAGQTFGELLGNHSESGDYLYLVQPLPTEYRSAERQREAMMAQFSAAADRTCK